MSDGHAKPLPAVDDPLTAPFWMATREHRIVAQRCVHCSYLRWPPGPVCPECGSREAMWADIRASGTLWSFAEYHRAFSPAFASDLPYTVGLVELDDGPRMYGTLRGAPGSFTIGDRVRAEFEDKTDDVTLVAWRIAEGKS